MKSIILKINQEIVSRYPHTTIGYLVVDDLQKLKGAELPESIRSIAMKGINENNLTLQNLADHSSITAWRRVYQDCGVKPKTFKSSVEALLRRFTQNEYRNIIPVVDLYNYVSAGFILPIGGYDLHKIEDELELRFGRSDDHFLPLNGKEDISVTRDHIVYADRNVDGPIVCWMWNHKDSRRTMLNEGTLTGLFIFDCGTVIDQNQLSQAQNFLKDAFQLLGACVESIGKIDKDNPSVNLLVR